MAENEKRIRNNRFDIQWQYAGKCWNALVKGEELPEIPKFQIYESVTGGKEKLIKETEITPMLIIFKGVRYFG